MTKRRSPAREDPARTLVQVWLHPHQLAKLDALALRLGLETRTEAMRVLVSYADLVSVRFIDPKGHPSS